MRIHPRFVVLAAAAVLAAVVLAGLWITGRGDTGESAPSATSGAPTTSTGAVLPAPTAFSSSSSDAAAAPVATTASAPVSAEVLEPGPDAPVATDTRPAGSGVGVVVTYADWVDGGVEVNGFVTGVVEDGGTCRLTLTRGTEVRTVEGAAAADASTTTCGSLIVAGSGLAAGDWSAVLSYVSAGSAGTSPASAVTVPTR